MSKILVTGGAGYIGSHACKALAEAGYEPIAFDNLATGWRDSVRFGVFEEGNLLDAARIDEVIAKHQPDAIMHFASLALVGESMDNPGIYWNNNVLGSLNLLQAAAKAGIDKFVFSSTCATFGEHDGVTLDENTRQQPINAYGASKLAIEQMLGNFGERFGINHVIFRYFNVAGADESAEIGEQHDPETHLIPLVIWSALGQRPELTIFGRDYPTPDGTCVRDYVHVSDLIDAHIAGLKYLEDGKPSNSFNLGTGKGFSVQEVVSAVEAELGVPVSTIDGPRRPGDSAILISGSNRAQQVLGWKPERSTLDRMIRDANRWHSKPKYSG